MGISDLERLYPIYRAVTDFCKLADLPFSFKEDLGSYETILVIDGTIWYKPKITTNWETVNGEVYCPDIIDYTNHIIIEFEEETGPRKPGAKLAMKGHGHEGDCSTKKDNRRNHAYKMAGFTVFRLWESTYKNKNWKLQLFEFLIDCSKRPLEIIS